MRHVRGDRGRLAQEHEDRFHADRAVRDVARRQADRHQQVLAFLRRGMMAR